MGDLPPKLHKRIHETMRAWAAALAALDSKMIKIRMWQHFRLDRQQAGRKQRDVRARNAYRRRLCRWAYTMGKVAESSWQLSASCILDSLLFSQRTQSQCVPVRKHHLDRTPTSCGVGHRRSGAIFSPMRSSHAHVSHVSYSIAQHRRPNH